MRGPNLLGLSDGLPGLDLLAGALRPNTNYVCLDGYKQRCDYPNGWVPAN